MDAILDAIRVATTDGASDEERQRGAAACRTLADHLEPDGRAPGFAGPPHPASPPAASSPPPPSFPATTPAWVSPPILATHVAPSNPFAGLTTDQVLDLVIARLRHTAGPEANPTPVGHPFQLHLVPVPRGPR